MRNALLVGSFLSLGTLMVMACGSSSSDSPGDNPPGSSSGTSGTSGTSSGTSGTSGTSGSSGDAGDGGGDGGIATTTLKSGEVLFLGITTDGYVAYISVGASTASLEVVPATGGAPTVIAPTFALTDGAIVSGAAVAFWQGVTPLTAPATGTDKLETGVGALSYWTKATGTKAAIEPKSLVGQFYSSADSSRIAFSVGADISTSGFAVTSAATGSATPVLTGGSNSMDVKVSIPAFDTTGNETAPPTCAPFIDFVGKVFMASYCTANTAAKLFTVADGAITARRLDAVGNATGTIQPFWSASTAADKILVVGSDNNNTGRIIFNTTTPTSATVDTNMTTDSFMLDDGSAVVYQTQNTAVFAFHRATALATPVKTDLITTGARRSVFLTPDQKRTVYTSVSDGVANLDLHSFTNLAASTPVDLVTTDIAFPFGITPDSATLLFQTDLDNDGNGKLNAIPVAGGTMKTLLPSIFDLRVLKAGTGSLVLTNPQTAADMSVTADLSAYDLAGTAAPTPLATNVPLDGFEVTGATNKTLVFAKTGTGAGLFTLTIP